MGMAGVVEAGAVLEPREAAEARVLDLALQDAAALHLCHMENALLRAAMREAVDDASAIGGNVVPVERREPGGVGPRVDEYPLRRLAAVLRDA